MKERTTVCLPEMFLRYSKWYILNPELKFSSLSQFFAINCSYLIISVEGAQMSYWSKK